MKIKKLILLIFIVSTSFSEDLTTFHEQEIFGYKNKENKIVIQPKYNMASDFDDNVAVINDGKGFYYIDKKGNITGSIFKDKPEYQEFDYKNGDSLYVYAQSGLNLRDKPSFNSKIILTIPYGDKVQILGKEGLQEYEGITGNWCKIKYH